MQRELYAVGSQQETGPEYQPLEEAFLKVLRQIDGAYAMMRPEAREALTVQAAGRKWGGDEDKLMSW